MTTILITLALILGTIVFLTYAGLLVNLTQALKALAGSIVRHADLQNDTIEMQREQQALLKQHLDAQNAEIAANEKLRVEQREHMAKCEERFLARIADAGEPTSHTH